MRAANGRRLSLVLSGLSSFLVERNKPDDPINQINKINQKKPKDQACLARIIHAHFTYNRRSAVLAREVSDVKREAQDGMSVSDRRLRDTRYALRTGSGRPEPAEECAVRRFCDDPS